jgi:hypothetical protein
LNSDLKIIGRVLKELFISNTSFSSFHISRFSSDPLISVSQGTLISTSTQILFEKPTSTQFWIPGLKNTAQ